MQYTRLVMMRDGDSQYMISILLNPGRAIKLELAKEAGDLHDRCMPRRPKTSKKDGGYLVTACNGQGNNNKG